MPESFSLNDLFTKGNKDQFKAKFEQIKNNPELASAFSIFEGDDNAEALDNIFATVDTSGDGIIDDSEIAAIKNKFQDMDQDTISENDFRVLYQEAQMKKFNGGTPEQMYNTAMAGVKDARESDYVTRLDNSILRYENFITNRQLTSSLRTTELQQKIDNLVLETATKKGIDTAEYASLSKEARDKQTEINSNTSQLQSKQRELERVRKETQRLEKEIKELKSDPEKNKIEISAREFEISALKSTAETLTGEIKDLSSKIKTASGTLKQLQKDMAAKQKEILKDEKDAAQQVQSLKDQISGEERSAQTDIDGYQSFLTMIQNAREYAITQIGKTQQQDKAQMSFNNNADAIDQNELSKYGLKYSKEKGEKLAKDMRKHAVGFTGYCSRHVSNGLQRTGLGNERRASAHQMDTALDGNKNFKRIQVNSLAELKALPAGCIVVYEANASWNNGFRTGHYNAQHGHIEVTLGDGTAASDGITRNLRYADPSQMSVFIPVENA